MAFPAEYQGNLFSAQHNARRIGRHVLVPDGSTFRSEDSDFLTSDDPDFHPSDVLEDADGSLLVIDTGAWYVQHCPTGRIRAARSRGGIYRVRRAEARKPDDPRGLGIDWAGLPASRLAELLGRSPPSRARSGRPRDDRARRRRDRLLEGIVLGRAAVGKVEAVWALAAMPGLAALKALRSALGDADEEVACAAARALARRADRGAERDLVRLLSTGPTPGPARCRRGTRCVAEVLERCRPSGAGLATGPDRFLSHALVHAVHRLADARSLQAALARPEPAVQAAGAAAPGPAAPAPGQSRPRSGHRAPGFAGHRSSRRGSARADAAPGMVWRGTRPHPPSTSVSRPFRAGRHGQAGPCLPGPRRRARAAGRSCHGCESTGQPAGLGLETQSRDRS